MMMMMMMFTFLTIVVLRGSEDLLEYNVDPILDSAHLDSAAIWKLFSSKSCCASPAFTPQFGIFHLTMRNAEMHLD